MSLRTVGIALKQAALGFLSDNVFTLAAALAFYAMLSAAPLLVLLTTVLGFLSEPMRQRILEQANSLVGPDASQGVALLLEHARARHVDATISAVAGLGIVVLTATAVFAQLQYSLNLIFNVRTKRGYVTGWFYKRLLSLLMVIAMGIVLVGSVIISSVVDALFSGRGPLLPTANLLSYLVVYTLVFVIVFKVLPDVRISWGDTWVGGSITAVLFLGGEYGTSMYFAHRAVQSVYGAAGSLVVLLLWVYYSALILFFGAELTQAYGMCCGKEIVPTRFAEWDPEAAKAHGKSQSCAPDEGSRRTTVRQAYRRVE
jgi:membrane protein